MPYSTPEQGKSRYLPTEAAREPDTETLPLIQSGEADTDTEPHNTTTTAIISPIKNTLNNPPNPIACFIYPP
jgi:hypothetical protein